MLLLLVACDLLTDTGKAGCTEIGCVDGIDLAFSLTEAGAWTVTATELPDGTTTSCTATLPFDGTEGCTGPGFVTISGTALPPDQQSLEGMYLPTTTAEQLHLVITHDDNTLVDTTYDIAYDTLQPNGPECGPVCSHVSIDVALSR